MVIFGNILEVPLPGNSINQLLNCQIDGLHSRNLAQAKNVHLMMTAEHKDHWPWDGINEGCTLDLTHAVIINIDTLT